VKKVNFSQFIKRLNEFNKVVSQEVATSSEVHAKGIVKTFKKKLKRGDFTPKLKPSTIARKKSQKMPKPTTPLYGWGESSQTSMYNGLRPQRIAKGKWKVVPFGRHGKISMQALFAIHEYGAHLKNGGVIRPRRPLKSSLADYKKSSEYLKENHRVSYRAVKALTG